MPEQFECYPAPMESDIAMNALCGDGWLFRSPTSWDRSRPNLLRLASLLLTGSPEGIMAILRDDPPLVDALPDDRYFVGDWLRRIYAAWIFGWDSVPALVTGSAWD